MSARSSRIICVFALIAFVQAACSLPNAAPLQPPPPADGTAAMQTALAGVAATLTQAAQGAPAPSQPPQIPEATMTFTSLPTLTPTVTLTPTPEGAFISVSTETKCRLGPGNAYDQVGGLVVGKTVEVFGRDPSGQFYYIRNPNNPATFCWVWANYATPVGNFAAVPVFTPAPTPSPTSAASFNVTYSSTEVCAPFYGIKFKITNNGTVTWESNRIIATDQVTAETRTVDRNTFPNLVGCGVVSADQNLEAGEIGYTVTSGFSANPAGHSFTATIRLCSQDGLVGTCLEKTITFTP
ncbi:MAG: SH3 domain-containing protein [Anaerolineales bacterium]|nr:SH3 domain-containing protein [Anaerolineales bacterium]MDO9348355.1 SH3 domain-containing protein [Anaerolineales bacterium]